MRVKLIMQSKLKKENGNIAILFALMFTVIMSFLSLALDLGMTYAYRGRMMEVAQVMRDTRFTKDAAIGDLSMHDEHPGATMKNKLIEYARKNDFNGKVTITYNEYETSHSSRKYKVRIMLEDTYECTTLKCVGIDKLDLCVVVNGSGDRNGSVWTPAHVDNGTWTDGPL